ncbi:MAG TPA: mechanosensitive ion channel domain-containing protein [Bryobacteraceae bacterium]|nr:mechanosensitive ion channel domain-containing protein [Bryobacteraceae bacterium]
MPVSLFSFAMLLQTARPGEIFRYFTLGRFLSVAFVLLLTWVLIRYLSRLLAFLSAQGAKTRFLVKWIEPVLRIALWFVAIFVSFGVLAPTQETFLAAVGSLAIAIGLGAQDLVKNLIGGLVILADRPYQLGDRVRIGDAYGEIDHIGLRSTKLTTLDDTRVTIPNANILDMAIFNANSGVPDCQVVTDLFLPCDTDPDLAVRIGYETAWTSPFVYLAKPVAVLLIDEYSETPYLRLRVKAYVFDHRYENRMKNDITVRAKKEFSRLGLLAAWRAPAEA